MASSSSISSFPEDMKKYQNDKFSHRDWRQFMTRTVALLMRMFASDLDTEMLTRSSNHELGIHRIVATLLDGSGSLSITLENPGVNNTNEVHTGNREDKPIVFQTLGELPAAIWSVIDSLRASKMRVLESKKRKDCLGATDVGGGSGSDNSRNDSRTESRTASMSYVRGSHPRETEKKHKQNSDRLPSAPSDNRSDEVLLIEEINEGSVLASAAIDVLSKQYGWSQFWHRAPGDARDTDQSQFHRELAIALQKCYNTM